MPAPLRTAGALDAAAPPLAMLPPNAVALEVTERIQETADAVSLVLRAADPAAVPLAYAPGQFLTFRLPAPGGGFVGRCYSLSSSPFADEPLRVTVKRTLGGFGSNWLCDNAAPGLRLEALAPAGLFTPPDLNEDLLLIAGGSGITPMLSILASALLQGRGRIVLVYASADAASVIFAGRLAELAAAHPTRLTVTHWLADARGLPTAGGLQALLAPFAGFRAFVCGPGPFMDIAREALAACGVPDARVAVETFVSLIGDPFAAAPAQPRAPDGGVNAQLSLNLYGEERTLAWPRETALLDLLLSQGLEVAYSCRQGVCATCICKLEAGRVRMAANLVLSAADLAAGYVLACQARPDADACRIVF